MAASRRQPPPVARYNATHAAARSRCSATSAVSAASLFELEDARRTLLGAETALVTLERERAAAWVALYRATGGGWRRDPATAGLAR